MEEKVIIKIPDELNRGESFIKVPSNLLRLSHISDGAKVTYMLLLDYSWQKNYCFPSQSTLSNLRGVSIKTIYNHLNELRRNNFITWSQNGFKKPNTYFLNEIEYLSDDKQNIADSDLKKTTTNDKKDKEANNKYFQAGTMIIELLQNASVLYCKALKEEKREILKFLFSNLTITDERLSWIMNKPFDDILKPTIRSEWSN